MSTHYTLNFKHTHMSLHPLIRDSYSDPAITALENKILTPCFASGGVKEISTILHKGGI